MTRGKKHKECGTKMEIVDEDTYVKVYYCDNCDAYQTLNKETGRMVNGYGLNGT